jgi:arylsulfatase A-like enzyme
VDYIQRQQKAGKPFFVWVNFTHMHFRTHPKPESIGQSGDSQSPYHDTMIDHDRNVGAVLKALDDLGVADNTLVMYSTDNGPHMNSWPDGAMTRFRSERIRIGRAHIGCRAWCAGQDTSSPDRSRTRSSPTTTSYQHCWPSRATNR